MTSLSLINITLIHLMTCSLRATSHYLYQYWLLISEACYIHLRKMSVITQYDTMNPDVCFIYIYIYIYLNGRLFFSDGYQWLNSLAPGRFQIDFRYVIFKLNLVNVGWGMSHGIALRWMPLDLADDKSSLVQVVAWCRQATSHYLSQRWSRPMSPNGVTRPQWVNTDRN